MCAFHCLHCQNLTLPNSKSNCIYSSMPISSLWKNYDSPCSFRVLRTCFHKCRPIFPGSIGFPFHVVSHYRHSFHAVHPHPCRPPMENFRPSRLLFAPALPRPARPPALPPSLLHTSLLSFLTSSSPQDYSVQTMQSKQTASNS